MPWGTLARLSCHSTMGTRTHSTISINTRRIWEWQDSHHRRYFASRSPELHSSGSKGSDDDRSNPSRISKRDSSHVSPPNEYGGKDKSYLLTSKQGSTEALQHYLNRLIEELNKVDDYEDSDAIYAVIDGFRACDLLTSLVKQRPTTMTELIS